MAMVWKATLLAIVLIHCGLARNRFNVKYQWRTPEYAFTSQAVRQSMIDNGSYIPGNPFIIDVDVAYTVPEKKVFVTTPRLFSGTAATLSVLSQRRGQFANPASSLLRPYPSWAWNRQGDCSALTSVFRTQVDSCGRLWVLDSGVVDVFTNPNRICQPQVVIFDTQSDTIISRYRIPQSSLSNDSLLINIAVDVRSRRGNCHKAFAYISDVVGYALIVYDAENNRSWRVTNDLFLPDPAALNFTVGGQNFEYSDGIFGLALGPLRNDDRKLYFHSLSRFRESWVKTSVLRNETLFQGNSSAAADEFQESELTRPSQTAATAMDKQGVLFFNLLSNSTLNCWNSRLPYGGQNLVELARDEENIQFLSGMKVVRDGNGREEVWALSCRFQDLITLGAVNQSQVNFRVLKGSVSRLVRGTSCDLSGH